ncbi:aspartate aminotransferase [Ilyonectria robusta]
MAIKKGNNGDGHSRFSALQPLRPGGPFALDAKFRADPAPKKVNLLIGAYRDDNGKPWQLTSVAKTISGTGANSLIAHFAQRKFHPTNIWIPDPTWDNHIDIWRENAPGVTQRRYPYYDEATRSFDFKGMMQILQQDAQENDAILLHACAHNPTGLDPTREQWQEIALLCNKMKLFVVFDSAYQGFASGDLDRDAWAMRHFFQYPNIEMAVCQSFSKNLGLYGERVGALHLAVSRALSPPANQCVLGHLIDTQRSLVSMAPQFGARVAAAVLSQRDLRDMWISDLEVMSGRIKAMRQALYDELVTLRTSGTWEHIVEQTEFVSILHSHLVTLSSQILTSLVGCRWDQLVVERGGKCRNWSKIALQRSRYSNLCCLSDCNHLAIEYWCEQLVIWRKAWSIDKLQSPSVSVTPPTTE